jgi:hypothetical protein
MELRNEMRRPHWGAKRLFCRALSNDFETPVRQSGALTLSLLSIHYFDGGVGNHSGG